MLDRRYRRGFLGCWIGGIGGIGRIKYRFDRIDQGDQRIHPIHHAASWQAGCLGHKPDLVGFVGTVDHRLAEKPELPGDDAGDRAQNQPHQTAIAKITDSVLPPRADHGE